MDGQWPLLLFTQPIEQASNFTDGPYGIGGGYSESGMVRKNHHLLQIPPSFPSSLPRLF